LSLSFAGHKIFDSGENYPKRFEKKKTNSNESLYPKFWGLGLEVFELVFSRI